MLSSFGHYLRTVRDTEFKKIQKYKDELLLYWSSVFFTSEIQMYFFDCNQSHDKSISNILISYIKYLPAKG